MAGSIRVDFYGAINTMTLSRATLLGLSSVEINCDIAAGAITLENMLPNDQPERVYFKLNADAAGKVTILNGSDSVELTPGTEAYADWSSMTFSWDLGNNAQEFSPTPAQDIVAADGITAAMILKSVLRVQGSDGVDPAPVTITADPAIAPGVDCQKLLIEGRDDTNTVTLDTGNGVMLNGGTSMVFAKGCMLELIYDSTDAVWYELYRSVPA